MSEEDALPPKVEEGELWSGHPSDESPFPRYSVQSLGPPSHGVAPLFAHATPQERYAAFLRRMNTSTTPGLHPSTLMVRPAGTQPVGGHSAGHLSNPTPIVRLPPTGSSVLRALPAPATPAAPAPAQQISECNTGYGDGGTGSGPTLPQIRAPPTAWLSYECQRRRFNPEFKITQLENGRYKCDIVLQGVVVEASGSFDIIQDAKNHTAVKAHKVVQKWPSAGIRPPPGGPPLGGISTQQQKDTRQQQRGTEQETEEFPPEPSAGVDMSDPVQARAFVEGYRMGQLAAGQNVNKGVASRGKESKRSRSRSPKSSRNDHDYRSRSSVRDPKSGSRRRRQKSPPRYHDGSRHNPSLPSTDRYRPDTKVKQENDYGRLKEDDFSFDS